MQEAPYKMTRIENKINVTKLVTIHYYEFDKKFAFAGESHDFWEMVYVDSGSVEIVHDTNKLILKQGEIIFHQPNEFHSIKSYDSSPNFFVISFVCNSPSMKWLSKFHVTLNKTLKPLIAAIISEAESTFLIPKNDISLKHLKKKQTENFGGEQMIKLYLEQFLIQLIRNVLSAKQHTSIPLSEDTETVLVKKIKTYINDNLTQRLYIEDICASVGFSKSYLSKIFMAQCGDTIGQYMIKKKISMAKTLIREHVYNFAEISDMLGFSNSQYFSQVFKRETGLTPSEFKNSLNIR